MSITLKPTASLLGGEPEKKGIKSTAHLFFRCPIEISGHWNLCIGTIPEYHHTKQELDSFPILQWVTSSMLQTVLKEHRPVAIFKQNKTKNSHVTFKHIFNVVLSAIPNHVFVKKQKNKTKTQHLLTGQMLSLHVLSCICILQ